MKPCLADVNVLVALLVRSHSHHAAAYSWWSRRPAASIGLCRTVQLSTIRILSSPKIMQASALTPRAAWDLLEDLLADERMDYWPEPPGIGDWLPRLLRYPAPTPQLVADVYLAAFALARRSAVVTFDQGFRQFAGLDLELLN